MTFSFDLLSLILGSVATVPLILGSLLLAHGLTTSSTIAKAQVLAGVLMLIDAVYIVTRTLLIAYSLVRPEISHLFFYTLDCIIITIFGLVPFTILNEQYPKWWVFLVCLSPLLLIPCVYLTNTSYIPLVSHLLPIGIGIYILQYVVRHALKEDNRLPNFFADPDSHTKSWVIYISVGYLTVTILSLLRHYINYGTWFVLLPTLCWAILIILLFLFLYNQKPSLDTDANTISNDTGRISDSMFQSISEALIDKCEKEELYLQCDFTLDQLAQVCPHEVDFCCYTGS